MPRKRTTPRVIVACLTCQSPFETTTVAISRGRGTFCSRDCFQAHRLVTAPSKVLDRFWSKVDKNGPIPEHCPERGPCWEWTAGKTAAGYGFFNIGGVQTYGHRFGWTITNGEITNGLHVLHHCDYPACVRADPDPAVSHLFLGTHLDNMRDMEAKGRRGSHSSPGELSHRALLTNAQADEIRRRYAAGGISQTALGLEYGITQTHVSDLVCMKIYVAHLHE